MSQDLEPGKTPLEPVKSLEEGRRLLREASKALSPAFIWVKGQNISVSSNFQTFSESEGVLYFWTPKGLDPAKYAADLQALGIRECLFNIAAPSGALFFVATFIGHDAGGLRFKSPQKLFKVQRRQDMRMPILDTVAIKVDFQDPIEPEKRIQKRVLDISAGGMAFLIPSAEEPIYHAGQKLEQVTFKLKNQKLQCSAEIRHMKALPASGSAKGIKVGIKFHGLSATDSQLLVGWVTEESRKYFMRFMA